MATVNEKMKAIADAIRSKTGGTEPLSLDGMAEAIENIESGVSLPTLTNEGSASDLLYGKQLIDSDGEIVTGTIETKSASYLTASGATVTVPAGYYATEATKSVKTAERKKPGIGISDKGLITSTVSYDSGYVESGIVSAHKQMTTQASKTITPSKDSQTAVASGIYTIGAVTVAAIPSEYIITTDADALAVDMRKDKTAYVDGVKVTGTIQDFDGSYECSGESTGGGSGGASIVTGDVTYTKEMGESPGMFNFVLTFNDLYSSTRRLIIIFAKALATYGTYSDVYKVLQRASLSDSFEIHSGSAFHVGNGVGLTLAENTITIRDTDITSDDFSGFWFIAV